MITVWQEPMPNPASNRHEMCSFILGDEGAEEKWGLVPLSVPDSIFPGS